MSRTRFSGALFLLLATAVACNDATTPTAVALPDAAMVAKGGPIPAANRLTSFFWSTDATSAIQPDGRYTTTLAGYSEYRHGVCGVKSNIEIGNRGGDNLFVPNYSWTQKDKATCTGGAIARRITVAYRDDPSTPEVDEGQWAPGTSGSLYVRRLYYVGQNDWGTTTPYASTEPIIANWIDTMDLRESGTCGNLWFNPVRYPGSTRVIITQATVNGGPGWEIRSDASQGDKAWCENKAQLVSLPFVLLVQDLGPAS